MPPFISFQEEEKRRCSKAQRKDEGNSTSIPISSSSSSSSSSTRLHRSILTTTTTSMTSLTTAFSTTTLYESISQTHHRQSSAISIPFVMPMPNANSQTNVPNSPGFLSSSSTSSSFSTTSRKPSPTTFPVMSTSMGFGPGLSSESDPLVATMSSPMPTATGCPAKRDGSRLYPRQACSPGPALSSTISEAVTTSLSSSMTTTSSSVPSSTLIPVPDTSGMPGSHTGNGHNGDGHNGDGHHDGNGNGSSKNTVAIAGGVGAAGAIAIFSLLILFFLRRQRRKRGEGGAAGAVEKAQGGERKWKKLGSRLRVNVQGLQGPVHTAGPKMTVFKSAGSKLAGIVPERFRRGNGGSNPFGQLRSGSAGSNFVGTRSTATPEANVVNEPQSTIIRSGPLSGWRQMLGERSAEPSPQPYPFLINNPLGRPPVPRNGSAVSLDPFVDPPEPIYLRITNPDPGTPDSNGNTPRPKYLTTGPVAGPGVSPGVSPRPSAAMEPTSYPFPISTPEDPFIDPPANATIKNLDEIPASLVPAALIPRRPIGRTGNNDSNLLQPSQYKPQRAPWSPIPPLPTQTVEDPVPELPRTVPSLPYSVPTNSTFDPTSTIYFVPSSHNSITPIETPLTPDLRSFLSRSASKDTKARSDPFDLDRPEIWASLRSTNARARGSETTDTGRTSKSDGSAILNWEERDRESRITRDRWSRANPGRESPTIGIGY